MIKKNSFVQIYQVVLSNLERATHLPLDTKEVPFEVRMKGRLLQDAKIGEKVSVETATKRIETGILIAVEPHYEHSFGHHVEVIREVRNIILKETEDLV
ncbi:MAG: 2-amino-4-oxopentanoate thiolase subunit OrtA [Acholeplasmataceae bacterium]|jgi:hypothetical protein|nr:2-amino-4-oxopentanoate thiolase subunit OrtA [Acholeplasmataceae bacterium]